MRFYVIGHDPENEERRILHQLIKDGKSAVFKDINYPKPTAEEVTVEDIMQLAKYHNVKKLKK